MRHGPTRLISEWNFGSAARSTRAAPAKSIRAILSGNLASGNQSVGGEGGIRTHDTLARIPVFKTGAFNRSATSPKCWLTVPRRQVASGFKMPGARHVFTDHRHLATTGNLASGNCKPVLQADRVGFEPTKRLPVYALSRRVPSATRPPIQMLVHSSQTPSCKWLPVCRCRFYQRATVDLRPLTTWRLATVSQFQDGWGGIRTHDALAGIPVFETGSFSHSDTHPDCETRRRTDAETRR